VTRAGAIAAIVLCGCFSPDVREGQFSCSDGDPRCPGGLACDPCSRLCVAPEHVCAGAVDGGAADRAAAIDSAAADRALVDRAAPVDETAPADQAVAIDASGAIDQTMPSVDAALDFVTPPDATLAPDLTTLPDLAMQPDLATVADLKMSQDLVLLPDLTVLPDMTCIDPTACNGKCGTLTNKCGKSVGCGGCANGFMCTGANLCCETDATLCAQKGATCGTINVTDSCGQARSPSCGACGGATPRCNPANHQCVQCLVDGDCPNGTAPLCLSNQCGCGMAGVVCDQNSICSTYDQFGTCKGQPGTACQGPGECASFACENGICDPMMGGQPCRTNNDCVNQNVCQAAPNGCQ